MKREELDNLKAGTLHLDCVSIELRNHDGSRSYSGPGYIRQSGRRGFEIIVFVAEQPKMHDVFAPLLMHGLTLGALVPHTHYWSMTAGDTHYRTWTAERITYPSTSGWSADATGHTVCGETHELVRTEGKTTPTARARCHMRAFATVRFPRNQFTTTTVAMGAATLRETSNRNVAEVNGSGFKLELLEEAGETVLQAESETQKLHPFFESRVTESLLFALGTHISWPVVVQLQDGVTRTTIRAPEKPLGHRSTLSPILFDEYNHPAVVWRLFELYLAYVLPDIASPFHGLSALVLPLVDVTDGSVEAQALTAAVGVESLLDGFFNSVAVQDAETTRKIDELIAYLNAFPGDETLRKRAIGSVGQLKKVRPDDRLRELVRRGDVSDANVTAWRELRNSVAHGNWSGVRKLQSFIDRIGAVNVLFYQLAFCLIGYTGKHTDWGGRGWPMIDYPPQG